MSQVLREQLLLIHDFWKLGGWQGSPKENGETIAGMAMAEIGTWAGAGRIETRVKTNNLREIEEIHLRTTGFKPKDWSVKTPEAMVDQLVLVSGEPWLAECVARLRKTCPSQEVLDTYIAKPDLISSQVVSLDQPFENEIPFIDEDGNATIPTPVGAVRNLARADGTLGFFRFHVGTPSNFQMPSRSGSTRRVYAVLLHDPSSPVTQGKVLGALALDPNQTLNRSSSESYELWQDTATYLHVSPLQHKMLNGVFKISDEWATSGVSQYKVDPSYSFMSCIPGLPNDIFVPLENELTSDSDAYENSWKHYLNLAKQAASNADALGRELIDTGLQKELRREAAGEELGAICGKFGSLDNIETKHGQIDVKNPTDNQSLQNCFAEEKYDIVFLGKDPFEKGGAYGKLPNESENPETPSKLSRMKEILNCNSQGSSNDLCKVSDFSEITHAGLGLVEEEPKQKTSCNFKELNGIVPSLLTGFNGTDLMKLTLKDFMQEGNLLSTVQLSKMKTETDGSWSLVSGGVIIMSSENSSYWPGCRRPGQTCIDETFASQMDKTFRETPGGEVSTAEVRAIRWRVEGALWTLAAMVGHLPGGMFETVVPIVNWTTTNQAPFSTVYGNYTYEESGFTKTLSSVGLDPEEPATNFPIVANAYSISPTWLGSLHPNEVSQQIKGVYDNQSQFFHVKASNKSFSFKESLTYQIIQKLSDKLSGQVCSDGENIRFHGNNVQYIDDYNDIIIKLQNVRSDFGEVCQSLNVDGKVFSTVSTIPSFENKYVSNLVEEFKENNVVFKDYVSHCKSDDTACSVSLKNVPGLEKNKTPVKPFSFSDRPTQVPNNCWNEPNLLNKSCLLNDEPWEYSIEVGGFETIFSGNRFTRRFLWPTYCGPDHRVPLFLNSHPTTSLCAMSSNLAQSFVLACNLHNSSFLVGDVSSPPNLTTVDDIPRLVAWIRHAEAATRAQSASLYLEKVPQRIVQDFHQKKSGSGDFTGDHGALLLNVRSSMESLLGGWLQVVSSLNALASSIEGARLQIQAVKLASKSSAVANSKALVNLEMQQMQIHASMTNTIAGMLSACGPSVGSGVSFSPVSCAAQAYAGINQVKSFQSQLTSIDNLKDLTDDEGELNQESSLNQIQQILHNLQALSVKEYSAVQQALIQLRQGAIQTLAQTSAVADSENKAQYHAAKGAGADFVEIDGQVVSFPVNTVLNRQYDVAKYRYEKALNDAKSMAFIARKAIEQRIGIPFFALQEPVGTVEAPALWADDVCDVQGIDYEQLKTASPPGSSSSGPGTPFSVENFASQYIGDYVAKLEHFVEHYNVAYPSHEGDDVAILSLREDLLTPAGNCNIEAPNLLYHSGDLTASHTVATDESDTALLRGWSYSPCDVAVTSCIRVAPGASVIEPPFSPAEALPFEYSWLYEVVDNVGGAGGAGGVGGEGGGGGAAGEGGVGGAGAGGTGASGAAEQPPSSPFPGPSVAQRVTLAPGAYVFSWWDQARSLTSEPNTDPSYEPSYTVFLFTNEGVPVASESYQASPGLEGKWSSRRVFPITIKDHADYVLLFRSNPSDTPSSFLIGATQLEASTGQGFTPGPYYSTSSTRLHLSAKCKGTQSAQDFQTAFTHHCETDQGCYYELKNPIFLDTSTLAGGNSFYQGKIAAGNFNYRHINVSLNLAGTSVTDCSQVGTSSCYGSGYIEYSLFHDAYSVGILNYNNQYQSFSFGSASINHAKGLAAEKYITNPISSADQGLLSQASIQKPEFRGRPLDGTYRLRIWDSPSLRWDRLEDIQLILTYRYWAPILKKAPSP